MRATVVATTKSGSRYVFLMDDDGVHWTRLPAAARADPMVGWLPSPPPIVQGKLLMLGSVISTPVTRVSFLPSPAPVPSTALPPSGEHTADDVALPPEPRSLLSLFAGNRH